MSRRRLFTGLCGSSVFGLCLLFGCGAGAAGGGGGGGGGGGADFLPSGELIAVYDQGIPNDCFNIVNNQVIDFEPTCTGGNILATPTDLVMVDEDLEFRFGTLTITFSQLAGEIRVTRANAGTVLGTGELIEQ